MYLICNKEDNRIFETGQELDYLSNGYPRLIDKNIAFPTEMVNVYEVAEIPENVEAEKYCYTEEKGFYENENYREYFSQEDRISALEDTVNMLLGF